MSKTDLATLLAQLETATKGLSEVEPKRLFGCDGFFTRGNIFAMIWKEGRIALRLPDERAFAEAIAAPGAAPWKAGTRVMKHWVFVPPSMERDAKTLAAWTKRAHALNADLTKPAKPAAKSAVKAKNAAKRAVQSRTKK